MLISIDGRIFQILNDGRILLNGELIQPGPAGQVIYDGQIIPGLEVNYVPAHGITLYQLLKHNVKVHIHDSH